MIYDYDLDVVVCGGGSTRRHPTGRQANWSPGHVAARSTGRQVNWPPGQLATGSNRRQFNWPLYKTGRHYVKTTRRHLTTRHQYD